VARNEQFQSLVAKIATLALDAGGDIAKLLKMPVPGSGNTVEGQVQALSGSIGEKLELRRAAHFWVSPGVVSTYAHAQVAPDLGRIGVLVSLKSSGDAGKLAALGRQIAMHVAAANPLALTADKVDPALIEREKAIFADQARATGKPENVIAKMVEGRLRKFFDEVVLLEQPFIMDNDKKVAVVLKDAEKDVGAPISIEGFVRYALGEGIQKDETDFAAEVAAAAKG
jgi:elongation factor Ts